MGEISLGKRVYSSQKKKKNAGGREMTQGEGLRPGIDIGRKKVFFRSINFVTIYAASV